MTTVLPDGSAFFVATVGEPREDPIVWNPWNKVVQDHRDGTVHHDLTDVERSKRGLPVPWVPEMADTDVREPPVF